MITISSLLIRSIMDGREFHLLLCKYFSTLGRIFFWGGGEGGGFFTFVMAYVQ